jgi:chromosome segregation ATPase
MSHARPASPARQRIADVAQRLAAVQNASQSRKMHGYEELLGKITQTQESLMAALEQTEGAARKREQVRDAQLEKLRVRSEALEDELAKERGVRGELESRLEAAEGGLARLARSSASLRDDMDTERNVKDEMENTMMKLLEGLCARVQRDIATERSDREDVESMMLNLIEDACQRLEGHRPDDSDIRAKLGGGRSGGNGGGSVGGSGGVIRMIDTGTRVVGQRE